MEDGIVNRVRVFIVLWIAFLLISTMFIGANRLGNASQADGTPEKPLSTGGSTGKASMNFVDISTGLPLGDFNFVAFGNFNGDVFIDMAFGGDDSGPPPGNNTRGLYAYTGNGGTGWTDNSTGLPGQGSSTFGGVAFGDANNNGSVEIYGSYQKRGTGTKNGAGAWERSSGAWSTTGIISPNTTGSTNNLALANITGNGGLDMVIARGGDNPPGDNGLKYYEGSWITPITWTEYSTGLPNSDEYIALAVADMNKDGRPDIVAGTYSNLGVKFYTQDASGTSWTERPGNGLPATGNVLGLAVGDINNDTHMDIVYAVENQGLHARLGNSGDVSGTNFVWTTPTQPGEGLPASATSGTFNQIQLADFDMDNDLDLLAPKSNSGGGLHLYLGNGTDLPGTNAAFTELTGAGLPTSGLFYGANYADIDNDGDLDIGASGWSNLGAKAFRNDLNLDQTPPHAISWGPMGTGVPLSSNFTVQWNETMNWDSVNASFNYSDGITTWDSTAGTFLHDPVTNTSIFNPMTDLSLGTIYTVNFNITASDLASNLLDQNQNGIGGEPGVDVLSWTFTTTDDLEPPQISNVLIDGLAIRTVIQGTTVILNATLDDSATGGSDIASANFTDGATNWPSSTPMSIVSLPTSPVEEFNATIDTTGWALGPHDLYVYGSDSNLNENITSTAYATLIVSLDVTPPEISNVQLNGATSQSYPISSVPAITLTAVIDDNQTGGSNISGANYTVGQAQWPGTDMDPADAFDSPTEGVTKAITPPSAAGVYYYYVYGWDEMMNSNTTSTSFATLTLTDDLAPEIISVFIDGLSTATYGLSSSPSTVTLTATIDDSATGGSNIGGANFTTAPASWPSIPMNAQTPPFDSPVEVATYTITTPQVPGTYKYYVYAWDSVPNANNTGPFATLTIVDDMAPMVLSVLVNGQAAVSVSPGAPVTLTATVDDSSTGGSLVTGANYTIGQAGWPGIDMSASNPPFDSVSEAVTISLDTSGWAFGTHYLYIYGWDNRSNLNLTSTAFAAITIMDAVTPIADAGDYGNVNQGGTLTLNGSGSSDNSGTIASYNWTLIYNDVPVYLSGVTPSFKFEIAGDYTVILNVTDTSGNYDTDVALVHVTSVDTDGDGLSDYDEDSKYGTDKNNADTDGDGISDGDEVANGTNPLVAEQKDFLSQNWWIIAIVIVVVVVLLLLLLFLKRRKSSEEKPPEKKPSRKVTEKVGTEDAETQGETLAGPETKSDAEEPSEEEEVSLEEQPAASEEQTPGTAADEVETKPESAVHEEEIVTEEEVEVIEEVSETDGTEVVETTEPSEESKAVEAARQTQTTKATVEPSPQSQGVPAAAGPPLQTEAQPAQPEGAKGEQPLSNICKNCGKPIEPDYMICLYCGALR